MTSKAAIGATRAPRATLQSCPTARDTPVTHRVALATAAVLLLAAALLVACGGSSSSSTSSTSTAKAKSGSGGAAVFTAAGCGGCQHTRRRPQSRDGRSQPRPAQAQHGDGREAGRERRRRDAGIPWTAHTRPDPRRRPVRRTKRQQLIGACQRQRLLALDLRNASGSIRLAAGQQHACWSSNPAVRSALCRLPLSEGRRCRGLAFWRRPGKWQGLDGSPRFPLPERLCAVRDEPGVPAVARSREHFRAGATGRDALRGTRKPSACRLSVGRGPSPFVVPVAVPVTDRSPQVAGR